MITKLETYLNEGSMRKFYKVCVFRAENSDEYKTIQKVLFEKGFIWKNTSDNIYLTAKVFPQVIWCWFNDEMITTSSMRIYDEQRIMDYVTEENLKYENNRYICPIIFKANDIYHLETILKYGNIAPEYKSRKIERTLESVKFDNKYEYDVIIIHLDNNQDGYRIQKLLFKYNILWGDGIKKQLDLQTNLDICVFLCGVPSENKSPCILFGNLDDIKRYYIDLKVDDIIYTIEDYRTIENILKYGSKIGIPSYEPRKIERSLESNNYKEDYNCIIIEFKNENEVTVFKNIILNFCRKHNLLTDNIEYHFSVVNYNKMSYYSRIFKNSNNNLVIKGGFIKDIDSVTKNLGFKFDKVHYVNELEKYLNDFFNIIPSYKPRKIERTLESNNLLSYYNTITGERTIYRYRLKTENEFIKEFGENWNTRVDWVHPEMDNLYGVDYRVTEKLNIQSQSYDKLMNGWSIHWNMLIENDIRPTYNSKKFSRDI